jgi:hypothetical protein
LTDCSCKAFAMACWGTISISQVLRDQIIFLWLTIRKDALIIVEYWLPLYAPGYNFVPIIPIHIPFH